MKFILKEFVIEGFSLVFLNGRNNFREMGGGPIKDV